MTLVLANRYKAVYFINLTGCHYTLWQYDLFTPQITAKVYDSLSTHLDKSQAIYQDRVASALRAMQNIASREGESEVSWIYGILSNGEH